MIPRRPWISVLCLLTGALLVGVAGLLHPRLAGDGAEQLTVIAAAGGWRAVHWVLLFAFSLVVAGLAGLASRCAGTTGEGAARAGICLAVFGYAVAAVGVLFMLGAGGALADAYARADLGLTGTHAVFAYDMLHPFAQGSIRIAAFSLAFATYAFGWAVATGGVVPRALGYLGVVAGAAGAVAAIALPASSPAVILGTALATGWQLLVAVALLLPERRSGIREA